MNVLTQTDRERERDVLSLTVKHSCFRVRSVVKLVGADVVGRFKVWTIYTHLTYG